jgi:hypothetical protein
MQGSKLHRRKEKQNLFVRSKNRRVNYAKLQEALDITEEFEKEMLRKGITDSCKTWE